MSSLVLGIKMIDQFINFVIRPPRYFSTLFSSFKSQLFCIQLIAVGGVLTGLSMILISICGRRSLASVAQSVKDKTWRQVWAPNDLVFSYCPLQILVPLEVNLIGLMFLYSRSLQIRGVTLCVAVIMFPHLLGRILLSPVLYTVMAIGT